MVCSVTDDISFGMGVGLAFADVSRSVGGAAAFGRWAYSGPTSIETTKTIARKRMMPPPKIRNGSELAGCATTVPSPELSARAPGRKRQPAPPWARDPHPASPSLRRAPRCLRSRASAAAWAFREAQSPAAEAVAPEKATPAGPASFPTANRSVREPRDTPRAHEPRRRTSRVTARRAGAVHGWRLHAWVQPQGERLRVRRAVHAQADEIAARRRPRRRRGVLAAMRHGARGVDLPPPRSPQVHVADRLIG